MDNKKQTEKGLGGNPLRSRGSSSNSSCCGCCCSLSSSSVAAGVEVAAGVVVFVVLCGDFQTRKGSKGRSGSLSWSSSSESDDPSVSDVDVLAAAEEGNRYAKPRPARASSFAMPSRRRLGPKDAC
eukprot:scaffold848_cov120-Amphora_coffeaeformis.AAC.7